MLDGRPTRTHLGVGTRISERVVVGAELGPLSKAGTSQRACGKSCEGRDVAGGSGVELEHSRRGCRGGLGDVRGGSFGPFEAGPCSFGSWNAGAV